MYAAGQYSVNRDRPYDCDVDEFESSLAAAGRARPAERRRCPTCSAPIAAYGGDFLAGMSRGSGRASAATSCAAGSSRRCSRAGGCTWRRDSYQAAVTVFRRAIEHEPLNESAHRELMTCWARLGETARAVRHYAELTALLRAQVGVPPAAETTALYERLSGGRCRLPIMRHFLPSAGLVSERSTGQNVAMTFTDWSGVPEDVAAARAEIEAEIAGSTLLTEFAETVAQAPDAVAHRWQAGGEWHSLTYRQVHEQGAGRGARPGRDRACGPASSRRSGRATARRRRSPTTR